MTMFSKSLAVLAVGFFFLCVHQTAACSFTVDFGDGAYLDTSGIEHFQTAPGAVTTCVSSCVSGSAATQFVRYGGAANEFYHDGANFNVNRCDTRTVVSSQSEECEFGWALKVLSPYVGLKFTCTCDDPGDGCDQGSGFNGCFSESVQVEVQNKGPVDMTHLQVGDIVLTGNGFQPVYSFGHKEVATEQEFLQLYTASHEDALELTRDHLVFVVDTKTGSQEAVRAGTIKVGDILATDASAGGVLVTKVATAGARGAYLPLTPGKCRMMSATEPHVAFFSSQSCLLLAANSRWKHHGQRYQSIYVRVL